MSRVWFLIGRISYWIAWPISLIGLYFSKRTRVLIICNDEVLLVKNWLGSGDWQAPGGGLHKNEDPRTGATRELKEELGLVINSQQLSFLYEKRAITSRRLKYYYVAFALELSNKPAFSTSAIEIVDVHWFQIAEIKKQKIGNSVIADMIAAWEQRDKT